MAFVDVNEVHNDGDYLNLRFVKSRNEHVAILNLQHSVVNGLGDDKSTSS